jgi:uncharacterized membrane protein
MRRAFGHRQRGQTIAFAAVAMVAIVGGLAIVIDGGIFFVVQRQLQTAADAGALAGAWHDPICLVPSSGPAFGCLPGPADAVAVAVAQANADTVKQLCGGVIPAPTVTTGTTLVRPSNVNTIVVTVSCDAPYSFGRILNLITPKHITASAAAATGNRNATNFPTCDNGGDMTDFLNPPPCGHLARLID